MDYIVNGNQQFIVEVRKRKKQPLLKIALETINELVRMANQRLEQEERLSDTSYVYLGKEKSLIGSQEYMRKIQSQIEHSKEAHYRSEQYAREEWGNR